VIISPVPGLVGPGLLATSPVPSVTVGGRQGCARVARRLCWVTHSGDCCR